MTKSLKELFSSIKEALLGLDACFAPQAAVLRKQRDSLVQKSHTLSSKKEALLRAANVPTNERTLNVQGYLAGEREKLLQSGIQLNTYIATVEQKISSLNSSIRDKASQLKKLEQVLEKLNEKKSEIKREIDERGIIESIWKYLFGDPEKSALSDVNNTIKCKYAEQKEIQADCDKLRQELASANQELTSQCKLLEQSRDQLESKNKKLATISEAMKIEDELEQVLLQINAIEINIKNLENKAKENQRLYLQKLASLCQEVRANQPQLDSLEISKFGISKHYPDMYSFGRLRIFDETGKWRGFIPRLLPFPFKRALCFDSSQASRDWVSCLLLRAFQILPCNHLSITVIDPIQLGKSLPAYQLLLKNNRPFAEQRFLTRSDEIEVALNTQLNYIENLLQHIFVGGISNWEEYNNRNQDNQLDYRILLLFDIPEQLSDKSNLYLSRIIEHGPKCGVFPIVICDFAKFDDRKNRQLLETIKKFTWKNDDIYAHSSMTSSLKYLRHSEEQEVLPSLSNLEKIIDNLSQIFTQLSVFSGTMEQLWGQIPLWSKESSDGLFANIGWTTIGNTPVVFSIGGVSTEHHTLLGGKSGSGKSNLLHILINSLCHNYSPNELNLFLLDYKQGTEFNIYSNPYLPHARLVATESDIDYGITVLKFLVKELEKRSSLFKSAGAITDYRDFRKRSSTPIPRILLIIDEFQMLFSGELNASLEAEKLLVELLRQGRAYGIHLLLATQTLRGLQNQSIGQLISQMGCRIALSCAEEDSSMLLGNTNWEAAKLQSPPEGILNNENGNKSANIKFNIPFAPSDKRRQHQEVMLEKAEHVNIHFEKKVFNGNTLPEIPCDNIFTQYCQLGDTSLFIGKYLDFEAADFIVNIRRENLLIAGYDGVIREGLATSIMKSICSIQDGKRVLIYQAHEDEQNIFADFMDLPFVTAKDSSWDGCDLETFAYADSSETFIIIDSLDFGRMFLPTPLGSLRKIGQQQPTPGETLRTLVDASASTHIHVILFVESYKRFSNSARELLNQFDLRIGFGLDEDDAGNFISSGGYGKFKGLRMANKAIFVNRKRNLQSLFKPFVNVSAPNATTTFE